MRSPALAVLLTLLPPALSPSTASAQRPAGGGGTPDFPDHVVQVELDVSEYATYGRALAAQVEAGDGAGIDGTFRNSGVVIDEANGLYYAVNGVHPVTRGDFTSYYPKSIVAASLATDEVVRAYSFTSVRGHGVDMEGLTFAGDDTSVLYVGDEYNFIYALDLNSGDVTREWDLASIGVSTATDRGIEALTYSSATGHFYAGIQETGEILVLDLKLESASSEVELIDRWQVGMSPSGLFAHPNGQVYVTTVGAAQYILRFARSDGTLYCAIRIPEELNVARSDGIYITADDATMYLVDSQGPLYDGVSLFEIAWTDPCV